MTMVSKSKLRPDRKQLQALIDKKLWYRFQRCKALVGISKNQDLMTEWITNWCDQVETEEIEIEEIF